MLVNARSGEGGVRDGAAAQPGGVPAATVSGPWDVCLRPMESMSSGPSGSGRRTNHCSLSPEGPQPKRVGGSGGAANRDAPPPPQSVVDTGREVPVQS